MKALTIKQPWAWAIARGGKDVENRTWSTPYRGPLAIHAGKTYDRGADGLVAGMAGCTEGLPPDADLRGAIVAIADLVGVHIYRQHGCSQWGAWGQYHWVLANVRPLDEPIRCRGYQGLWTPDADVLERLEAAIA